MGLSTPRSGDQHNSLLWLRYNMQFIDSVSRIDIDFPNVQDYFLGLTSR